MKVTILAFSAIVFLFVIKSGAETALPLLIPKKNFKQEILNCVFDATIQASDVIMLRIGKESKSDKRFIENESFEIRVTLLTPRDFALFNLLNDKYLGYFKYKKHIILVYGDAKAEVFFLNTKSKKKFDFLSIKSKRNPNNPPVSLEPNVLIYHYSRGDFSTVESGIGFYE